MFKAKNESLGYGLMRNESNLEDDLDDVKKYFWGGHVECASRGGRNVRY